MAEKDNMWEVTKLPEEWALQTRIEIKDPDGWREHHPNVPGFGKLEPRPFNEKITWDEFKARSMLSTIMRLGEADESPRAKVTPTTPAIRRLQRLTIDSLQATAIRLHAGWDRASKSHARYSPFDSGYRDSNRLADITEAVGKAMQAAIRGDRRKLTSALLELSAHAMIWVEVLDKTPEPDPSLEAVRFMEQAASRAAMVQLPEVIHSGHNPGDPCGRDCFIRT